MRKLKVFLAALVLLTGGGSLGVFGQASYNKSYTEGVEVAAGNDYFLYNIESKTFFSSGMDWGTRASGDHSGRVVALSGSDGAYSIWSEFYSANGSDIASGYLTNTDDEPFVDNNLSYGEYTFTAVSVSGYTNAYTIKNGDKYLYYNTTDTRINWGDTEQHWLIIPKSVRDAAGDYTYYIQNQGMNRPWQRAVWGGVNMWTSDWSNATGNYWAHGGNGENPCAEKYHKSGDIYQTISSSLAAGRYRLSVQAFYRQDDNASESAPILYIGDNTSNIGVKTGSENSMTDASTSFSAGNYVNNVEAFLSEETANVKIGLKTTGSHQWVIWDNFVLDYLGHCVMDYAVELPDGDAMAADTWYYFDIATAADNYTATAKTLGDIICTTDGYALTSATSGDVTLTAENNNLSATRYYVKSSSAQSLAIAPASYSYSISEASANVSYIQADNTVTVSYTTSSNDPDATLTQDYSGVTFGGNAITVTPTASGFTFTVPTVTANTDYTLSIPAGAIKYNEENTNAAQDITLKTPAVLDGTYFLKAAATYDGSSEGTSAAVGKYMARGTAYSTHLSLDSYGLPVAITTDGSNQTFLRMADTNGYVFSTESWDAYADGSDAQKTSFTISVQNSKYLIASNNRGAGKYLKYNTENADKEEISVFDDGTGTNNGPIIMWAIESISEHATAMQAKKDAQAAAAAAAAYASGNYESLNGIATVTALESELTANYIEGAFVSPTDITSVEESYQPRNNKGDNLLPVTVYSSTINITEAGFYKFSMQAFNRATWNENVQAMHDDGADMPAAVLFFGDSETQIKSLYDEDGHDTAVEGANPADAEYKGKYYANCKVSALKMFKDDKYHNDVWFYCSTPGTYTYGVKVMGYASGQWFIYSPQSVTITSYAAAASTDDYTALQGAIEAYDAATWGFEAGEYAPYNNSEAINNIAAAKAIKSEETNSKLLVNSLSAKIALTANTARMNAIGYGDFATYETIAGKDYPYGWNLSIDPSAPSNLSRIMGGSEGSNNAGLSASTSGKALLIKYNATYGDTEGYTMPLKAKTVYKLSFKYCGWGSDALVATNVVMTAPDNSEITLAPGFTPTAKNGETDATLWSEYTGYFVTTTAGNYKLNLNKAATGQHQIAIADIDLQVGPQYLDFTDDAVPTYAPGTYPSVRVSRTFKANKWATAVYPFAITAATGGIDEIATLESFSDGGTLGFSTTGGVSTANEPFMMRTDVDGVQMFSWGGTGSEVQVYAAAETPTVTKGSAKLIGAYAATPITNAEKNYVLSNNTIYPVGSAGATIPAYRAYIQIETGSAARSLKFVIDGEETTGIDGIAAESVNRGEVYNLNGQRVASPRKGLYIQNGKKVLVK